MKKLVLPFFYFVLLTLLFSACRKDEEEKEEKEQFPVFGTCEPVTAQGRLNESLSDSTIIFVTNGGGKIILNQKNHTISISHKDYSKFEILLWGVIVVNNQRMYSGYRENLNGKNIKHKITGHRTIVFPDGAKLTMVADSAYAPLKSVTIYDGDECHHINLVCNKLEFSSSNSTFTKQIDDAEPDGETGTFEITSTGLLFYNIYTEITPGEKVEKHVPLGELFKDSPYRVNDYYEDPVPPQKDKVPTDMIRSQDAAELKAQGMNLYAGTNPPLINGSIKLSPFRFDYAKPSIDIAVGTILKDLSFEFSEQTTGKQTIKVKSIGDFLNKVDIYSAFITGTGNNFTVCFSASVTSIIGGEIVIDQYVYFISGTTEGSSVKNVKLAKVGVKRVIPNANFPSKEGNIEIYSDSDGKSEWTKL